MKQKIVNILINTVMPTVTRKHLSSATSSSRYINSEYRNITKS